MSAPSRPTDDLAARAQAWHRGVHAAVCLEQDAWARTMVELLRLPHPPSG